MSAAQTMSIKECKANIRKQRASTQPDPQDSAHRVHSEKESSRRSASTDGRDFGEQLEGTDCHFFSVLLLFYFITFCHFLSIRKQMT